MNVVRTDALSSVETIVPTAEDNPLAALRLCVHRFADFLVTKHGLARALRSDQAGFEALHAEFLGRLLPVCDRLLKPAVAKGLSRRDVRSLDFLHGVGNLCIGVEADPEYDVHGMIDLFIAGLTQPLMDSRAEARRASAKRPPLLDDDPRTRWRPVGSS
jgi:hypothetical protein